MPIVEDVLPILDQVRGEILDELCGFNSYDIMMRTIVWDGERPGDGVATKTDTTLTLDGTHRIKIERVSGHAIIASGGFYAEGDWKVGPLTPSYPGGGRDPSYFNPPADPDIVQEVYYQLTGPGLESGSWFKMLDAKVDENFGLFFTLRATNVTDP